MVRTALRGPIVWLALLLAMFAVPLAPAWANQGPVTSDLLVYHQIADLVTTTGSVGDPMLSADGTTGVFADAPATGDPATPNRIFTIGADGSGLVEVDSYPPLCFCGATIDISNDGETVVSSDSMQIRIADGGGARELVVLGSNEITSVVLTGDGETVFFIVRRDTATAEGAVAIQRGVWAIDADGEDLRQVVGIEAIADLFGFPVEQSGCCFHGDGRPLAVSDDGTAVVFGTYGTDGEYVLGVDGDGGNLHELQGPNQYVMRVAISGGGSTVAWDVVPVDATENDIGVQPFAGGEPVVFDTPPATGFRERLQLSADGSLLLVSPDGLLIDTDSSEAWLLSAAISGAGGNHEAVITEGLPRATMNADGSRFLYVMHAARCADCLNLPEQLATLDINPADPGAAPAITDVSIEPAEIGLGGASSTTITAAVESTGGNPFVGFVALLDGSTVDTNLGGAHALDDDGTGADVAAGDDVYSVGPVVHAFNVARDSDEGPRTVRIAAEYLGSDGLRHGVAIDAGTLVVTGG